MAGSGDLPDDAVAALDALAKRFPTPNNAQALAALDAFHQHDSAQQAIDAGVSAALARPYLMPLGILPRMRLLAFGWEKPGDTLRQPTDAAWWARQYTTSGFNPRRLWEPLGTYVDKVAAGKLVNWNQELADGNATAIARSRNQVAEELARIQSEKADICAPFIIPAKRGVVPPPENICIARIEAAKQSEGVEKGIPRLPGLPWWAVLALIVLAAKAIDDD